MGKRFHSIEYVDDEGEQVVKHAMLTPDEAWQLVQEFAARGASVAVHDLTPPQVSEAAVLSGDEAGPRLEAPAGGGVE